MKKVKQNASRLFQRSALCAALSLSIFGGAQALTLSRPVAQSKQGEALRVEIDITEITAAEQIELSADIANSALYKAAKIDLPMANGQPLDIQVQLLRRDHGSNYLQITSKQPVSGNFLDLLIDLRWANGRLLRDISVSLDDNRTPKPKTPVMAGSTEGRSPKAAASKTASGQILVKRGDTASELSVSKIPDGVSLDQMLLALVRNNPDAFVDDNVNRMKEGALLTLPTEQEAKSVSREEARKAIQVQTRDFEAYRAELAARAPGGQVPKVARDVAGKLEAQVQNKTLKAQQDKLTLTPPGRKEAAVEDNIAKQREAQEVAERASALSRNISELGKIAAATVEAAAGAASTAASEGGVLPVEVPASAAQANGEWLDELRDNALTPVGAGSLIAFLVLIGLWRRRVSRNQEDDIQGLPPLNVKFNLDLPERDHAEPFDRAYIHDVATHSHDLHEHLHDHEDHAYDHEHDDDSAEHSEHDDALDDAVSDLHAHAEEAPRPTMEMPNISLDLDEPDHSHSPYQVRIDLANELWNLGQLHTSKALMEEVANEASGFEKEKALQWLAERG